MQGAQAVLAIVAPPCRLANHRQDGLLDSGRRSRLGAQRLQPVGEASLEGGRFQGHEETAEDILTGDPVGQVEHLHEKLLFQDGPPSDRRRPAGAGEHRQQSDDDHTLQGVPEVDLGARILQYLEMPNDLIHPGPLSICHGSPPVECLPWFTPCCAALGEATQGNVYTKTPQGASITNYQDYL